MARLTALLASLLGLYERLRLFVSRDVWRADLAVTSRLGSVCTYPLRIVLIVVRGFFLEHQCLLRASALTYNTLLSVVPMLAFMLAFLKGLGVHNLLEPFLLDMLAIRSEEMVRTILYYANNIEVRTLGGIGLGTLLITTMLGVGNVERSFNEIWGVRTERPILRKIADYASVLVLAPVALLLATGINTRLHSPMFMGTWLGMPMISEAVSWFSAMASTLLPYVALWLVFTFFYSFLPNTRVHALPALIGGIFGGTLWQISQWAYIELQVGMANAQAIYGALAQLPVLMLWLYVSWVTTLLGAEVAYACQHVTTYFPARLVQHTSIYVREWLAQALYFSLARTFMEGQGAWSAVTFAQQQRIPLRLLNDIIQPLREAGLLLETAASPDHYVPGRDPAHMTPWLIVQALRHHGDQTLGDLITLQDPLTTRLMTQLEEAQQHAAGSHSIPQWLTDKDSGSTPERSPS
ncbi:MAG: YihY/virulence factor BrkB family protein [Candidatus Tectomicrobia bacterium]|uniref:YihY/virulence factor BrkB family protein n=1 Tax=Tectimicrobiota bacterium TaxID=2528274 RepID=A0A937VZ76_UNCTE|nr:YihY/virulence factor BrkB family protein [Candidatus Tectomicrobia bacterium]